MREILFRGKRIDNGAWVEGAYFPDKDGNALICTNIIAGTPIDESAMCITWSVDPATIGQFTGLTDKNGKKIFEGDIIRFDGEEFVVVWSWIAADPILSGEMTTEVIGNIYDNPELQERD